MGKSSLVKAAHAAALARYPGSLALIEIEREDIGTLPELLTILRAHTRRCLVFCDDLSFEREDSDYKALKSVLDGGIEGRPATVLFYATSNRRHLMPRDMIENERATAINPSEATEEKVSLSDRFGLWIGFHNCDQQTYFAMVEGYAADLRLDISPEALRAEAVSWSVGRGGTVRASGLAIHPGSGGPPGRRSNGEGATMTSPMPSGQVPGIYRKRFGDRVVTSVSDGGLPADPAMLQNIELAESLTILDAARRPAPLMTAVNVFVIQSPGQTILVDTGAGTLMGPTAGRMMGNLAAAGIAPEAIDAVLMTHLHIDHVGGLLTADGAPAFPNADLLIPRGEADFWFDDAAEAAAPAAMRPGFTLARRTTTPYGDRVKTFTAAPAPGIEAVPLPGHTPGHTGYALGSGADRLLIWGDIMHAPEIQARRPGRGGDLRPGPALGHRDPQGDLGAGGGGAAVGCRDAPAFPRLPVSGAGG